MKNLRIYRNEIFKSSDTFIEDYETFKNKTGYYPTNGLLVVLLGKENLLSKKIMKAENFILSKNEKMLISEALEKYIDSKISSFKNADESDVYTKIIYKGKKYLCPVKDPDSHLERQLTKSMSLFNKFHDPNDEDIVEIKYHSDN